MRVLIRELGSHPARRHGGYSLMARQIQEDHGEAGNSDGQHAATSETTGAPCWYPVVVDGLAQPPPWHNLDIAEAVPIGRRLAITSVLRWDSVRALTRKFPSYPPADVKGDIPLAGWAA